MKSARKGTTLIEVLVAFAIFSVVIGGALSVVRVKTVVSIRSTVEQYLVKVNQLIGGYLASYSLGDPGPIEPTQQIVTLTNALGFGGVRLMDTKATPTGTDMTTDLRLISVILDESGNWLYPTSTNVRPAVASDFDAGSDAIRRKIYAEDLEFSGGQVKNPLFMGGGGLKTRTVGGKTVTSDGVSYYALVYQEITFIKDKNSSATPAEQLDALGDSNGVVSLVDLASPSLSNRLQTSFRVVLVPKLSGEHSLPAEVLGLTGGADYPLKVELVYQMKR